MEASRSLQSRKKARIHWRKLTQTGPAAPSTFPLQKLQKSFTVQAIPAGYPHPYSRDGTTAYEISYSQHWSLSLPSADYGHPGDMFIVISPSGHRIFIKKANEWVQWEGINALSLESQFSHPFFPTMVVWLTEAGLTWVHWGKITHKPSSAPDTNPHHPIVFTADGCIRALLQSTPLKVGALPNCGKTGGSLWYWRSEYERSELHKEKLIQENTALKNQITDMQNTVGGTPSMDDVTSHPDQEVLAQMKESLRRDSALRNLVLTGKSSFHTLN